MSYPGKGVVDGEGAVVWLMYARRVGPFFCWNFSRLIRAGNREISGGGLCVDEKIDGLVSGTAISRWALSVLRHFI